MEPQTMLLERLQRAGVPTIVNEPLHAHTSFKIGGPAALYCEPQTLDQLKAAIGAARETGVKYTILGNGSNVLFRDAGYDGLVVCLTNALGAIRITGKKLVAGAGAELGDVCLAASAASLSGLEFAYGIPGSVGGAVYMNAGAFDGEMINVLHSVTFLDDNLRQVRRKTKDLALAYRRSIFQEKPWCILSATFSLEKGDAQAIDAQMQQNMEKRREKQPLEYPSAGSAFKRPTGAFAGALIDQCGLRGFRVGDAAISEKHCGFIVNLGAATCSDVLELARHVGETVQRETGYVLEKEVRVVE